MTPIFIDPTGHKWSWSKFWKSAVAAVVSAVVFFATGGAGAPIIAGFWAGMVGGAVSGALSGGGIKAVLMGAAFGAITGALSGGLVAKFGGGFGLGLLAASGGYAAATGNLDSFAGGLVGGVATGLVHNAMKPQNFYADETRMKLPDTLKGLLDAAKLDPSKFAPAVDKIVVNANKPEVDLTGVRVLCDSGLDKPNAMLDKMYNGLASFNNAMNQAGEYVKGVSAQWESYANYAYMAASVNPGPLAIPIFTAGGYASTISGITGLYGNAMTGNITGTLRSAISNFAGQDKFGVQGSAVSTMFDHMSGSE